MEEHVQTFRQCCTALLTGINVGQANSWLTALNENKEICLPLCIAVVDAADAASIHSVFIASKIIHNVFRENRYASSVDLEYMQVRLAARGGHYLSLTMDRRVLGRKRVLVLSNRC